MNQKKYKTVTKRIPVTLTEFQIKQISQKIGILGSNQSDVVRYIVTNWLDSHSKEKDMEEK